MVQDGTAMDQEWIIRAFAAMDTDLSGEVDYTEFLAAAMSDKVGSIGTIIWAIFCFFLNLFLYFRGGWGLYYSKMDN